MIATLTMNPCVDRTVQIAGFQQGGTNKVLSSRCDFSGKGINVSIVLQQFQKATCCLGFSFHSGASLEPFLNDMDISHDLVRVEGELRTNIKVFDTDSRVMTEYNEKGCPVSARDIASLTERVESYLDKISLLVLNGSAPPGVPAGYYQELLEMAHSKGVRTILDASGDFLVQGIQAKPYLIKPNKDEIQAAYGCTIRTRQDALNIARKIVDDGVAYVCISLGREGALLVGRKGAYYSSGADIQVKGVQGAGDSLVAGICMAIEQNISDEEILRWGVSTAHGSLMREGTQLCRPADFEEMYRLISVERL